MVLSPTPSCSLCDVNSYSVPLLLCQACKVVHYCGQDHQAAHRDDHQEACNAIFKAQKLLDQEETKLRSMFPNVFEEEVGRFWYIRGTKDYMRARYSLVEALLMEKTYAAVEAAHGHCMDMLRLCSSDDMGIRNKVPALKLRLGKDQECYDFCKWWATTNGEGQCDWGNMSYPYLDIKDAEPYEPPKDIFGDLHHCVAVILVKIRLLVLTRELPHLSETFVPGNEELLMNAENQAIGIAILEPQIEELHEAVDDMNAYFWNALLYPDDHYPEDHLNSQPELYRHGSYQEMQLVLQHTLDAWTESPGARKVISELEGLSESEIEEAELSDTV